MRSDLILLHGALGCSKQFQPLVNLLEDRFILHYFDFVGHGSESFSDSFGIETFSEQLRSYIKKKALEKPNLFGYSMGGYVALFLEGSDPGILGKIITLATKYDWNPESSEREAAYLNIDLMRQKVPKYLDYLKNLHGDQWEETIKATREMMLKMGFSQELSEDLLLKVRAKCQIGVGELDKMVTVEETQKLSEAITGAEFRLWPDTEHPIEKINKEMLASEIREFLMN